jgi:nickel-dependent lactate racemase
LTIKVYAMKIDYGKDGLNVSINPKWNVTILRPKQENGLSNPIEAVKSAILNPFGRISLPEIINAKSNLQKVCIVIDDATRPVPSHLLLTALVEILNKFGVADSQIIVLIATGLHRKSNDKEIERMVGRELVNRLKIINHDSRDKNKLKFLGTTQDQIPIYINKHYYESNLKIVTGYVEPHFFFGFSGGNKSLVPGIAGAQTIQSNHSAENIASLYARFGTYENNPMVSISEEIASIVGVDFTVNVCINEDHEITQVAAGELHVVHDILVKYQLKHIFNDIAHLYDIVICGNGGYPLDLNLYQAVKSMAIGEMAVKKGGTIISVNECSDGIGVGQDQFKALLFSGYTPKDLYEKIISHEITVPDQWEIQILARIMMKAEIYLISNLSKSEIGNIGLKYAKTIEEAINAAHKEHGENATILILPNGPQILPIKKN